MSTRKVFGSASKSTSKQNLSKSRNNSANTTISSFTPRNLNLSMCIPTPTDNEEIEFDFAYNEYLSALLKKQILNKSIDLHKTKWNDQLEIQRSMISQKKDKETQCANKIKQKELYNNLNKNFQELTLIAEENSQIINSELEKHLDKFICELNTASNKLFLDNVQNLTSPEEYDKLHELLGKVHNLLGTFKVVAGDIIGIEKLGMCINKTLELRQVIDHKDKIVYDLKKQSEALTLQKASDILVSEVKMDVDL